MLKCQFLIACNSELRQEQSLVWVGTHTAVAWASESEFLDGVSISLRRHSSTRQANACHRWLPVQLACHWWLLVQSLLRSPSFMYPSWKAKQTISIDWNYQNAPKGEQFGWKILHVLKCNSFRYTFTGKGQDNSGYLLVTMRSTQVRCRKLLKSYLLSFSCYDNMQDEMCFASEFRVSKTMCDVGL
jgi:hypothetical protein